MRGDARKLAALMMLGGATIIGCSSPSHPVAVAPTGQVVVSEAPPPPRQEVAGTPPGPNYVWAQGYWAYSSGHWVWLPGHWQAPPTPTSTWVAGRWDQASNGWVWTPGHWQ